MTRFSVDTHLFRELGQLLVGRDSTALIELVKNAYDADATEVVVFGEHLADPERGAIRISDNGVGMDPDTFQKGFLRVAARLKNEGARRSLLWGRRFTGAKGIGRLAAHKLARRIEISSIPWGKQKDGETKPGVKGYIDWDIVESVETLDQVPDRAVAANPWSVGTRHPHGTVLRLTPLRQKWTKAQLARFILEVEALRAPDALSGRLPKRLVPRGGILGEPTVTDASRPDPGFSVELQGDFELGDSYWPAVVDAAGWLVEIDAQATGVRYAVAPMARALAELPHAKPTTFSEDHPDPKQGPFFHTRIFVREGGRPGSRDERAWASRVAGVRIYMEGFRVLPYGETADDWLLLNRDTNDRTRKLRFLADSTAANQLDEVDKEGLLLLPSKHYFGAVFLTANRAPTLEMLVNREGFVPNQSFETLVTLIRRGIDLSTRVRAAAKAAAATDTPGPGGGPHSSGNTSNGKATLRGRASVSLESLADGASRLEELADRAPHALRPELRKAASQIRRAVDNARHLIPANSMVLVLASVGTQLAAFTHEVNRLLSMAQDLESAAERLKKDEMPPPVRGRVARLGAATADLRRAIERQASYLVDIITPDARRRRSRRRVRATLDSTWRLVAPTAEAKNIVFENDVDEDHRSPLMFGAELMAIFTNLLTNAVKAAGNRGRVRARSKLQDDGRLIVRLENTGVSVEPADGERWFRPFESTTVSVDPVLGQGMGLGLGITRDLLAEVGATIRFDSPRAGFSTAIVIEFPGTSR